MTLGVTKRDRVAQRADKWWKSIYLKQMQMMDRGQVSEIIGESPRFLDKREPMVSYCSTPRADDYNPYLTDGLSVTKTNGEHTDEL